MSTPDQKSQLARTEENAYSISEILPWLMIADAKQQVIVNKDSSLMSAWEISGVDIESAEDGALHQACARLDEALRRLADDGAAIWSIIDRHEVSIPKGPVFNNMVAQHLDDLWRESLGAATLYANRHSIAVSMPTRGEGTSLGEATGESISAGKSLPKAIIEAIKSRFAAKEDVGFKSRAELEKSLRRFETTIAPVVNNALPELGVRRMAGAELLGYLKSSVSAQSMHPVAPNPNEYLDAQLSDSFLNNSYANHLILSGVRKRYLGVYALKTSPAMENSQTLDGLLALKMPLRLSVVWKASSLAEAVKYLEGARAFDEIKSLEIRKMAKLAAQPQGGMIDADDAPKTAIGAQAAELKAAARAREAKFGSMAATLVIYADSAEELELRMDLAARVLESSGCVFIRERVGALSAFTVGIPGNLRDPVRWHFTEASNVTDTTPLVSLRSGKNEHPSFTEEDGPAQAQTILKSRYSTVQYFNYHTGQLGHTLIVGPSRNGKTVFQMFMEAQFLKYRGARIFNIDKDLSCKPQTLLLGGQHFDLDPSRGGGLALNPIAMAKDAHGRAWLVGWLDRLLSLRGDPISNEDMNELQKALERIADVPGARLSTLSSQIPLALRTRLQPWCEGGNYGSYFDHEEDRFSMGDLTTTEVGGLLSAGLDEVVTAYAEYAFYRIERYLMDRGDEFIGPTMIYFEEAGFLLDDARFAAKARDYLMTLAKKKAFLVMTAQSPETFLAQPLLAASIRDNVSTIILLPNRLALRPELATKYREAFGLNETQIELVANAIPRTEYCVFQPQTGFFRVMRAQFSPEMISLLRSDAVSQAALEKTYNATDPDWVYNYLRALESA